MSQQTHAFQAEVAQLLHLVTHSLYSNKEIFLRELISNASDACDKLRFEALNDSALYEQDGELKIRIEIDKENKLLIIEDNGIGMSRQEAIDHLGTIAKSGTKDFVSRLTGDQKQDASLIGQFGVGFYSGFMVAKTITVETRRAGLPVSDGVRWVSGGMGEFTIETIEKPSRGTKIILQMLDECEEYLAAWKIKEIISKYSDHIALPIQMRKQQWVDGELIDPNDESKGRQPGSMVTLDEWETVNQATALWTRAKKDITKEQYHQFYQELSHDYAPPLAYTHNRVEGSIEYTQLLYIPTNPPLDLFTQERKSSVKLYVKRVFIMDDAQNLLPSYLRFVRGVVDANDLPLNVSREILQESKIVKTIRDGCTKRVLSLLEDLANSSNNQMDERSENEADAITDGQSDKASKPLYDVFYEAFGAVLKEGLGEDFANQARISKLLRFYSVHSPDKRISFADYKATMKEGQKAIYYITGESTAHALSSPQLEIFKKKGIDVLLMTDRVDEWALNYLREFDGTPLKSVAKGSVDLGDLQDESEKAAEKAAQEAYKSLIDRLKETLKDKAEDVRVTTRLVDSPACLVVSEYGMSTQLTRLLKQAGQAVPVTKPILEINPDHALVKKLEGSSRFEDFAHILFDQAVLAEGGLIDDPASYVKRINDLLV